MVPVQEVMVREAPGQEVMAPAVSALVVLEPDQVGYYLDLDNELEADHKFDNVSSFSRWVWFRLGRFRLWWFWLFWSC